MKNTLLSILALVFVMLNANSQSNTYEKEMLDALTIHEKAQTVTAEFEALAAFEKLIKKYPNEWLPSYWATYLCTQIGRLDGRAEDFPKDLTGKKMILKAKSLYDLATKKNPNMTDEEKSDFLMLEGFIYQFYTSQVAENDEEQEKYGTLIGEKYREALKINPQNPYMYVQAGIRLTYSENYIEVAGAIGLFDYAKSIYNKEPNRALTTYWSKDFIGFWRSQAQENLTSLLTKKEE